MLARVLVRDNDDQLADLAVLHPPVQLGHDLLDVGFYLVVGRNEHVQPVLLDGGEVLGRVDTALEEDRVNAVLELWEYAMLAESPKPGFIVFPRGPSAHCSGHWIENRTYEFSN